VGGLSNQVKHHQVWKHQEPLWAPSTSAHGSQEECSGSPIQPLRTIILSLWAPLVMQLNPDSKVAEPWLADPQAVYKRPPYPSGKGYEMQFPLSPRELLELSAHPFVTPVHLQYQTTGRRAITSEEWPKPHSLQVHLRTRTRDLDHLVVCWCYKIDSWRARKENL
jgi:hypothetical protein